MNKFSYRLTILLALICYANTGWSQERQITLELFVSPYCGLSVERTADVLPQIEKEFGTEVKTQFELINLTDSEEEQELLKALQCTKSQGKFLPIFIYVGRKIMYEQPFNLNFILNAQQVDIEQYNECLRSEAEIRIASAREKFDNFQLRGLPAVANGSKAYGFSGNYQSTKEWITKLQGQDSDSLPAN